MCRINNRSWEGTPLGKLKHPWAGPAALILTGVGERFAHPGVGASIADGYAPSALAGARPRHPLSPKGEKSTEMQKRKNQRRRRSACVSTCEPLCAELIGWVAPVYSL